MSRLLLLNKQRVIALTALLLASSLEICGCDLARNCEKIRGMQISPTDWPALVKRCKACFSSAELMKLTQAKDRLAASASSVLLQNGETVGQALVGDQRLSFYEPVIIPNEIVYGAQSSTPASSSHSLSYRVRPQPWPIPESVFFLYNETEPGRTAHRSPTATAFVVSVPRLNHRSRVRFLVTARHVVDPAWAHCSDGNPAAIEVRFNRLSGGNGYERIPLVANHLRQFFTPADDTADIAIVPLDDRIIPNIESYKFMDTPFRLLPTAAELAAIRDDQQNDVSPSGNRRIITASITTQSVPDGHSYPVADSGVLTSTAITPIEIQCGPSSNPTSLRLWSIDATAPQEISGAPVYTTIFRGPESTETQVLLGVQSVAWPGRHVAGITPSDALSDLIKQVLSHSGQAMDFNGGAVP